MSVVGRHASAAVLAIAYQGEGYLLCRQVKQRHEHDVSQTKKKTNRNREYYKQRDTASVGFVSCMCRLLQVEIPSCLTSKACFISLQCVLTEQYSTKDGRMTGSQPG